MWVWLVLRWVWCDYSLGLCCYCGLIAFGWFRCVGVEWLALVVLVYLFVARLDSGICHGDALGVFVEFDLVVVVWWFCVLISD